MASSHLTSDPTFILIQLSGLQGQAEETKEIQEEEKYCKNSSEETHSLSFI